MVFCCTVRHRAAATKPLSRFQAIFRHRGIGSAQVNPQDPEGVGGQLEFARFPKLLNFRTSLSAREIISEIESRLEVK
jgi:hypothetical protein